MLGAGRDNAQKAAVRHVDDSVDQHRQRVCDIGPDQQAGLAQGWRGKNHDAEQAERNGSEKYIGPIAPPACSRAVSDGAHHRVCDRVDQLGQQQHQADRGRRQPVQIDKEIEQEEAEEVEIEARGEVAHAIAQLLFQRDALRRGMVQSDLQLLVGHVTITPAYQS